MKNIPFTTIRIFLSLKFKKIRETQETVKKINK